jgi:very-short-patch-repair endonuclease
MKDFATPSSIREQARELRKQMTDAEYALWQQLRGRKLGGLKFRRQHPLMDFILDFYCIEKRLVVEVDGGIHENQKEGDDTRSAYLEALGCHVIRFKNFEVINHIEAVLEEIVNKANSLPSKN